MSKELSVLIMEEPLKELKIILLFLSNYPHITMSYQKPRVFYVSMDFFFLFWTEF